MVANKSLLFVGNANPTILERAPSVCTVQSKVPVDTLNIFPTDEPTNSSYPLGSTAKDPNLPSNTNSLSKLHLVS